MCQITFKYEQKHITPITLNIQPCQSILDVALDNGVEINNDCGGVCCCSTCHIYVEQGMEYLEEIEAGEVSFIEQANNPQPNSRLSCQCYLKENSGSIIVTIPIEI